MDLIRDTETFTPLLPLLIPSFLNSLSIQSLAYGSHRLACLNYVGRYCVGGRERKGTMFTVPTHGIRPQCCLCIKEGRW